MKAPEGKVKEALHKYLKEIGAYEFWPVQTGYGARTVDVLVCWRGLFIGIECKAPGKSATKFQNMTISAIEDAGGLAFVIDDVELKHFRLFVKQHVVR